MALGVRLATPRVYTERSVPAVLGSHRELCDSHWREDIAVETIAKRCSGRHRSGLILDEGDGIMVSRSELALNTVKYKTPSEIAELIGGMAHTLAEEPSLESKLLDFIDGERLRTDLGGNKLVFAVLLSFVLGDIGGQYDPNLRSRNIEKIQQICAEQGIDYVLVTLLTAYQITLTDMIVKVCSLNSKEHN